MLTYNLWTNVVYKDNLQQIENIKHNAKYKTVMINVNFPADDHHGCKFKCSFCPWEIANYNQLIYPNKEDVQEFISLYCIPNGNVEICGGGDPLFNFNINKDLIKQLTEWIIETGRHATMVTKDIEAVSLYWDSEWLQHISSYCFSIETVNNKYKAIIQKLLANDKFIRISKLYNFTANLDTTDLESIYTYLKFYYFDNLNFKITLRTNYLYQFNNETLLKHRQNLYNWLIANNITTHIKLNGNTFKQLQLTNTEVTHCCDTEIQILTDMGYTVDDYNSVFRVKD